VRNSNLLTCLLTYLLTVSESLKKINRSDEKREMAERERRGEQVDCVVRDCSSNTTSLFDLTFAESIDR